MRTCCTPRMIVAGLLLGLALPTGATEIEPPQLLSPGDGQREGRVGTACPTFSWTEVDGARGYSYYDAAPNGDLKVAQRALRAEFQAPVSWID